MDRRNKEKEPTYRADSCFLVKVIRGFDDVQQIARSQTGFINDKKSMLLSKKMRILVPGSGPDAVDGYMSGNYKE
jgi:hypothetical protein